MVKPKVIEVNIDNKPYAISLFNRQNVLQGISGLPVNIFASGPSITDIEFNDSLLDSPSIFVNGSLSLTGDYNFNSVIGYVITDERFIKHNAKILVDFYCGQPLYITKPVLDAITTYLPEIIVKYHHVIRVIYAVDRPIDLNRKTGIIQALPLLKKLDNTRKSLKNFTDHSAFIIDTANYPKPIGVTLNIEEGFVEAGTVAYVAAQLAYTLGASEINLYGIDLLNSSLPRFYENNKEVAPCKLDKAIIDRIVPSFDLLGRVYEDKGVRVFNHSPVSKDLFQYLFIPPNNT